MDTTGEAAYCRARAVECVAQAETVQDGREVRLQRAFADQFERRARALEEAGQQEPR
ncbi:MAG TPA: hypothetical protein VGD08_18350 [Stellaceae bacterium]|jgi:hypothetical protein